jgi:hypothetical protein
MLAVSFSNDTEARELAESYGTKLLLDKMKLFNELVPAIWSVVRQKNISTARTQVPKDCQRTESVTTEIYTDSPGLRFHTGMATYIGG